MTGEQTTYKIIPKERHLATWQANIILLVLLACGLLLGLCFLFLRSQTFVLQNELTEIEDQGYWLSMERTKQLKQTLLDKVKATNSFVTLLQSRKKPIKIFGFLKEICHKKAQMQQMSFTSNDNVLTLNIRAESFRALGEQILIFKNDQNIASFDVYSISLKSEDEVEFTARLIFKDSFFINL